MAMFCLNMLAIALELARHDNAYEDVATKFLEHFFHIAYAINDRAQAVGEDDADLWDNEDEFYYDLLRLPGGSKTYVRVRSMVGLIPLLAVETIDPELLDQLPSFHERLSWFLHNRADLVGDAASVTRTGESDRRLFAIVSAPRLKAILTRMLDEREFLSPHGLRSVSRWHAEHPFRLDLNGMHFGEVDYEPAESRSGLFGGNSNWRGPVWFPLNYLIIEALQKFDWYYGPTFTVEHPVGSGKMLTLWEVSVELSRRLIGIFTRHEGRRAVFGGTSRFQDDPLWRDLIPVSRILSWRQRRRPWRVASDWLDRSGGKVDSTEWRAGSEVGEGGTARRCHAQERFPPSPIPRPPSPSGARLHPTIQLLDRRCRRLSSFLKPRRHLLRLL
jgi:hypothetical protein